MNKTTTTKFEGADQSVSTRKPLVSKINKMEYQLATVNAYIAQNNRDNRKHKEEEKKEIKKEVKKEFSKKLRRPRKRMADRCEMLPMVTPSRPMTTSMEDDANESISRVLHNYFDEASAVGHSYAEGSEPTSISETFSNFSVTVSPGAYVNMVFVPYSLNNNVGQYSFGVSNASFANPFLPGAGITTAAVPTVYTGSPNFVQFRPVRFILKITPTTSLLNANGQMHFAYVQNLLNATASGVLSNNFAGTFSPFTTNTLNTTYYNRLYGFTESPVIHWFANSSEEEYTPTSEACSGIVGYIFNGGSVAITYNISYILGVEFVPAQVIVPFVHPTFSQVNNSVAYKVGTFLQQNKRAILSEQKESIDAITSGKYSHPMYAHKDQYRAMISRRGAGF